MCFFGNRNSTPAAPPPPAPAQAPAIEGAAVDPGYAETLTEKQKRLRAGGTNGADTSTDNSIIY